MSAAPFPRPYSRADLQDAALALAGAAALEQKLAGTLRHHLLTTTERFANSERKPNVRAAINACLKVADEYWKGGQKDNHFVGSVAARHAIRHDTLTTE